MVLIHLFFCLASFANKGPYSGLFRELYIINKNTPLSTLYNSLILKGLKFNNFLAKNCKPSIYRALEKRVESQVKNIINKIKIK